MGEDGKGQNVNIWEGKKREGERWKGKVREKWEGKNLKYIIRLILYHSN